MPPHNSPQEGLWKKLTGRDATSTTRQPKGPFQEEGVVDGASLTLSQQLGRVDLIWAAASPGSAFEGFPNGDTKAQEEFVKRCETLFGWYSNPPRVAFGAISAAPVEDQSAGYRCLDRLLPTVELSPGARDFMLQLNFPRQSSSSGPAVTINRLSKWSVAQMQMVSITSTGAVLVQGPQTTQFAARCEVDINTAAETQIPDGTNLVDLLEELRQLGAELKAKGPVE